MIKKIFLAVSCVLVHLVAQAQIFPNLGGQRSGISGLTFLKNDVSPRSVAMGGSNVAVNGDGYAIYANPAATIDVKMPAFSISNYMMPAGVNHSFLSAIIPNKNNGAWAFTLTSLTSGMMERRTEFQPNGTGEMFSVTNVAVGAGYAKKLSDMFSFGINLKYVNEQLDTYRQHNGALDLGFAYKTDFKDLRFAVALQHFGTSSSLDGKYLPSMFNRSNDVTLESYPAPTVFKMGVSMVPYKDEKQRVLASVQLNHPNDNAENIRLGVEYEYRQLLFLRAGYKINVDNEKVPTGGIGLRTHIGRHLLNIEYAANPTQSFGLLHSIGLTFRINRPQEDNSNSNE